MTYPVEHIEWQDHWSQKDPWTNFDKAIEDVKNIRTVHSVGFVVMENDSIVLIAQDFDMKEKDIGNCMYILKGAILSRRVMNEL